MRHHSERSQCVNNYHDFVYVVVRRGKLETASAPNGTKKHHFYKRKASLNKRSNCPTNYSANESNRTGVSVSLANLISSKVGGAVWNRTAYRRRFSRRN